jgi:ribosome biogenesis GTPase / thiamine phosphate phosphatase
MDSADLPGLPVWRRGKAPLTAPDLQTGLVLSVHGRHCMVEGPDGTATLCRPRAKKLGAVTGDHIQWRITGDEGVIEGVSPRKNLFFRQDEWRTKPFAANLDQVLILLAAEPLYSDLQITRALIAAEHAEIPALIGLNKSDLHIPYAQAFERLQTYRAIGYPVFGLSTRSLDGIGALKTALAGKTTLILGPSGVGKSSLVNLLIPGIALETSEISVALQAGKHTTTATHLYWMPTETSANLALVRKTGLIDSPGFQEFGLHHINPDQLPRLMPDIQGHTGDCRFYNCTHLHEPGCKVIAAVSSNSDDDPDAQPPLHPISAVRYRLYCSLMTELSQPIRY